MRRKYAENTELYILWSELRQRGKLSPTSATAHYSCPDNAIALVGRQLRRQLGGNFLITSNVYVDQALCSPHKLNIDSNRNTKNIKIYVEKICDMRTLLKCAKNVATREM